MPGRDASHDYVVDNLHRCIRWLDRSMRLATTTAPLVATQASPLSNYSGRCFDRAVSRHAKPLLVIPLVMPLAAWPSVKVPTPTITSWMALLEMPENKPRYLMGVGTPLDIVEAVYRGVDQFDCVLPTRMGRTASPTPTTAPCAVRAEHRTDKQPMDPDTPSPASHLSRGYDSSTY